MPHDATLVTWAEAVLAAAVVIYIIWSGRRDRHRSRTQREHQQLMLDLQRELNRHENILLGRCAELERKLDPQNRTLRYVRRRLT